MCCWKKIHSKIENVYFRTIILANRGPAQSFYHTMEDNDAQLISESFDKIYNNSANTTLLVRNQTSIVKNILSQVSNFDYQYNESIKI